MTSSASLTAGFRTQAIQCACCFRYLLCLSEFSLLLQIEIMTSMLRKNFALAEDNLNVWINEYQGKIRIHFRQPASGDEGEPYSYNSMT